MLKPLVFILRSLALKYNGLYFPSTAPEDVVWEYYSFLAAE